MDPLETHRMFERKSEGEGMRPCPRTCYVCGGPPSNLDAPCYHKRCPFVPQAVERAVGNSPPACPDLDAELPDADELEAKARQQAAQAEAALRAQLRGDGAEHYRRHPFQPLELIEGAGLGYHEGNIVKYVTRWRDKGGVADLEKALFYLRRLLMLAEKGCGGIP